MTYRKRLQMTRDSFKGIHRDLRLNPAACQFIDFRFATRVMGGLSYVSFDGKDMRAAMMDLARDARLEGDKTKCRRIVECAREIREINAASRRQGQPCIGS